MTAGMSAGNLALICDCDGVLIDSEAVAARMLVQELQARWPGADVEPVVLPLLGLRIESVLEGTAMQPGKRPRSSMAPTLVFDKNSGQLVMSGGSPGGAPNTSKPD